MVETMVTYGGVELTKERDGKFSFIGRGGLELAIPRLTVRMVNALIKKGYLKVIEHGDHGEALAARLYPEAEK
uniref:Uncharacterized protein n=1 Tax=Caulobacter phage BL57 TaxID=3348355 RepID=A0AB74UN35_9VIRU